VYELSDYLAMIDDQRRTSAYLCALRDTIRPGDQLLELGTGFGYFAVHAARLGAAHVWAVEPNDAIALGPALAAQHGVADRITFLQARSGRVDLPARADVLLEDLRGCSPLHGARLGILQDARARLLTPGARSVALRDHLIAAPATRRVRPERESPGVQPVDVASIRALVDRGWRRIASDGFTPLAESARWATLELTQDEGTDVDGRAEFVVQREGRFEGWATWFEAELAGDARISSGPESGRTVYDCGWYPLESPIAVRIGDRVALRMRATFDGSDYVWVWETTHRPADGGAARRERQSTLAQQLLSSSRRERYAATYVPAATEELTVQRALLGGVDGERSLAEIVAALRARFPARLRDERRALAWVAAELSRLDDAAP